MLAGLLGKLSLCSSTDGAPNWENLVYLTRLSHLSVDSAADVGVMLQVNFMPNLQTLNLTNYSLQANTVTNFLHLQHLMLTCGFDEVFNLESCTQLIRLEVWTPAESFRQLILPSRGVVQLQHLFVHGSIRNQADFTLVHLAATQCLTALELHNAFPSNLRPMDWPAEMSCLQTITLDGLQGQLPSQWLAYSHLQ